MAPLTDDLRAKTCTRCNVTRSIDRFSKCSKSRGGHFTICKDCKNASQRKPPKIKGKDCKCKIRGVYCRVHKIYGTLVEIDSRKKYYGKKAIQIAALEEVRAY